MLERKLRVRWRCTGVSPMSGGLRWEDCNFEASLGKININKYVCL